MPSLFKTLGAVLCLVFALCFAAPNAHADTFTPVFNNEGCLEFCTLPNAPDVTFPSPTTMTVSIQQLNSTVVNIPAGDLPGDTYSWIAAYRNAPQDDFTLVDMTNGGSAFSCDGFITGFQCGQLTFIPVATATPEPSSLALMLSGVGLVFGMRKRWGLSQAS